MNDPVSILERRLEREKRAREEAESLLESKSRELFVANQELMKLAERLEETVQVRTFELQSALAHLNAIINNIADAVIVSSPSGEITSINPMAKAMYRLIDERHDISRLQDLDDKLFKLTINTSKKQGEVGEAEVALPLERIGKASTSPIFEIPADPSLPPIHIGHVTLIRDITREKEIDRMKTDFISNVSHELRTPLTSVLGFTKIIKKKLDETIFPNVNNTEKGLSKAITQVSSNLEIILEEGERLTNLINDVLDIAKIESGKMEWQFSESDLSEIVEKAVKATQGLIQDTSKVKMSLEIEPNLPLILIDQNRILQVVINLLSNAIKFTSEGEINVSLFRRKKYLRLTVSDTGIGISPENQEKIFEKFQQAGETLTEKPTGSGLGLSISKQILEHHNGQIWAESELGKGSSFIFEIPIARLGVSEDHHIQSLDLESLLEHLGDKQSDLQKIAKILIVDDDPSIVELLVQNLESNGYRTVTASNGLEAIQATKVEQIDLIILDIMMPIINGYDVAAIIKNDPATNQIPIIVHTVLEKSDRSYKLGIDRYITKSADVDLLLREIDFLLRNGKSLRKIVVFDEKESVSQFLIRVLKERGFEVIEVSDSQNGIDRAIQENPDLVILDSFISNRKSLVRSLRLRKEMENVLFILLG